MIFLKLYLVTLPIFLIIDFIWLGFVANGFYKNQIGFLMKTNINWAAAVIFYFLFIAGMIVFVILPSLEKNSWVHALFLGSFFGFVTYATYDLTNFSTLKGWSIAVTVIDLAWGAFVTSLVSTLAFFIAKRIGL